MSEKRTELGDLGEFGLIDRISGNFENKHPQTIKGIGDDAAVIDAGAKSLLVSHDTLVEGVHFDLTFNPLKHLGYKTAVVSFSDIVAMNALPSQLIIGMSLSNRFSVEAVDQLFEGIKAACDAYKVDLVGGDTTSSLTGLVLSSTVMGFADKDDVTYRSGAQPGDLVCVTGDLGGAFAGLQVLEREKEVFKSNPDMQPELDEKEYIVHRHLKPEARIDLVKGLKELGIKPTSMIDISDGLASEVMHIATSSKVGITIYEEKLPIDQMTYDTALEMKLDPVICMLNGGEDFEILFTIRKEDEEKFKNNPNVSVIGEVVAEQEGSHMISKAGVKHDIKAQGWVHFKAND